MADANLLEVLSKLGKSGYIDNILIFGKVRCAVERPESVGDLKTLDGYFAILDTYAFRCLGTDYFGDSTSYSQNKLYFTKGSILIFIDSLYWVGKNVKVFGASSRRGVKIRQQWVRKNKYDGISALAFVSDGSDYVVCPNKLFCLFSNDPDARGTELEDFMVSVVAGQPVYPKSLSGIANYTGVAEYKEIKKDEKSIAAAGEVNGTGSGKAGSKYAELPNGKVDVTKIDLKLTYHLNGAKKSEFYDVFKDEVVEMSKKREEFVEELKSEILSSYKDYTSKFGKGSSPIHEVARDLRSLFVKNIASRYTEIIGKSKKHGSYYVSEFLKVCEDPNFFGGGDGSIKKQDIEDSVQLLAQLVMVDPSYLKGHNRDETDNIPLLGNDIQAAIAVLGIVSSIGAEKLADCVYWADHNYGIANDMILYVMIYMPYVLGIISSGISVVDCDILYYALDKRYGEYRDKELNMDLRCSLLFLENIANASDKDSLIPEYVLAKKKGHYPALAKRYLVNYGFMCSADYIEALSVYLGYRVEFPEKARQGFLNMEWYSKERKDFLSDSGIIDSIDDSLILMSDLEKEFMIYDVLIAKGSEKTGITQKVIDKTIEEFEAEKGFKLEKLQKEGIKLTLHKAGVLSGCAGSGKTTTSDCMIEVLKNLNGYNIIMCTPTGKACRRLAEVVKGTVRTIHSQFGVGIGGGSYIRSVGRSVPYNSQSKNIYILDEMAMCSMPLLFEICRHITNSDLIYFLGDIKQLPAIGKGNPFALLMKILPCVELGVSKRAAEGSDINYNTTLINCCSDGVMRELSYNSKDFICKECSDVEIPLVVTNIWKSFMNGTMTGKAYDEDDIQVITAYQKNDISFSSPQLNVPLQAMLRRGDEMLFSNGGRTFYKNDRIIHTKRNDYSMCRYIMEPNNTFRAILTFGMVNGEGGKIVDIVRSDMVHIIPLNVDNCEAGKGDYVNVSDTELNELLTKREARADDLRDDAKVKNSKVYFVIVKVYDVDLGYDVCVLYRASVHMQDGLRVFEGGDLGNMDLAYALTTHKMQGSQSPVVILPFGSSCNPMFVNRNMINTMVTRAQEVVCCVGKVKDMDSPINKGRKFVSAVKCSDALTLLANS